MKIIVNRQFDQWDIQKPQKVAILAIFVVFVQSICLFLSLGFVEISLQTLNADTVLTDM